MGTYALKRSPGIIRKSRVSYPDPGFHSNDNNDNDNLFV